MELRSTIRLVSDGTVEWVDLTFEVHPEDSLYVYFDGEQVEQGWTLMRESTPQRVNFDEPIPDGVDVIIRRASDLSEIPHVFHYTGNIKGGAEFNAKNMDENFSKILRASEDAMDSFELVGINVEAALDANLAADRAEAAADDAEQSYQNTLTYDQQGEQWMLAAQAAAIDAEGSKDLAYRWANEPENQPVEQGEFSAYHWAKKAQDFAGGDAYVLKQDLANPDKGAAMVARAPIYFGSMAALEAASLDAGVNVYLTQEGRAGEFVVKTGTPPDDPFKGIYIPMANGNYAERVRGKVYYVSWFGVVGDGLADDTEKTQSAIDISVSEKAAKLVNNMESSVFSKNTALNYADNSEPCLVIRNASNFTYDGGSCLHKIPTHGQGLLEVRDSSNVKVINGIFEGSGSENFPLIDGDTGYGEKGISNSGYFPAGAAGRNNAIDTSGYSTGGYGGEFPQWGGGTASTWGVWNGGFITSRGSGIYVIDSDNVQIRDCEVYGFNYASVEIQGTEEVGSTAIEVSGCRLRDSYDSGVRINAHCSGVALDGNFISDIGHPDADPATHKNLNPGYGTTVGQSYTNNVRVTNNKIERCKRKGIDFHLGKDLIVSNNYVEDTWIAGIFIAMPSAGPNGRIVITGNILKNTAIGGPNIPAGVMGAAIQLTTSNPISTNKYDATISNNVIYEEVTSYIPGASIWVLRGYGNVNILGNSIDSHGGITVNSVEGRVSICSNTVNVFDTSRVSISSYSTDMLAIVGNVVSSEIKGSGHSSPPVVLGNVLPSGMSCSVNGVGGQLNINTSDVFPGFGNTSFLTPSLSADINVQLNNAPASKVYSGRNIISGISTNASGDITISLDQLASNGIPPHVNATLISPDTQYTLKMRYASSTDIVFSIVDSGGVLDESALQALSDQYRVHLKISARGA